MPRRIVHSFVAIIACAVMRAPSRVDAQQSSPSRSPISLAVLGSDTPIHVGGSATESHVAAGALLRLGTGVIGLYAAPEFGTGGGYQSLMLGGGVALTVNPRSRVTISILGGYTTYSEKPTPSGIAPPAGEWLGQGISGGALVTARIIGPVFLAYRGQYVAGVGQNENLRFARHAFGLGI